MDLLKRLWKGEFTNQDYNQEPTYNHITLLEIKVYERYRICEIVLEAVKSMHAVKHIFQIYVSFQDRD